MKRAVLYLRVSKTYPTRSRRPFVGENTTVAHRKSFRNLPAFVAGFLLRKDQMLMEGLEELYGQEGERSTPLVLDLCKAEYWNARPLWQSDLDHFASLGISGLDLLNPDMVLKAGIILDDGGSTFVFEQHTETDGDRDAFILPVEGASGMVDLIAFDPEIGLLATWLGRAFAINEARFGAEPRPGPIAGMAQPDWLVESETPRDRAAAARTGVFLSGSSARSDCRGCAARRRT